MIIHFWILRVPVSSFIARKTRDSIAKAIYSRLFGFVLSSINQATASKSELSTSIIDIAGFGKNTFVDDIF